MTMKARQIGRTPQKMKLRRLKPKQEISETRLTPLGLFRADVPLDTTRIVRVDTASSNA
jgi:hypothetical protein